MDQLIVIVTMGMVGMFTATLAYLPISKIHFAFCELLKPGMIVKGSTPTRRQMIWFHATFTLAYLVTLAAVVWIGDRAISGQPQLLTFAGALAVVALFFIVVRIATPTLIRRARAKRERARTV